MEHAALARGHRRECVGLPCGTHFLNGNLGHKLKFAVAISFESVGVEGDAIMLFGLEAKDLCSNVLDGMEKFPVAGKEKWCIGPSEFDSYPGGGWRGGNLGCGSRRLTGGVAGVGLHLAVAGKDVRLQVQTACGTEYYQEVCYFLCRVARIIQKILHFTGATFSYD